VEPQLVENYVSTGEVFFEYRHLAFLGEESDEAAEASMCAMDQGMFWEYHDTIFHNQVQGPYDEGAFSRSRLDRIAEVVGLNMDEFGQCMDDNKYADEVDEMESQASAQGIAQTPSFLINGELVSGISSFEDLSNEIEARLPGGTPAPDATPGAGETPVAEATPTQ
jgi:protein-disulfide isomerase